MLDLDSEILHSIKLFSPSLYRVRLDFQLFAFSRRSHPFIHEMPSMLVVVANLSLAVVCPVFASVSFSFSLFDASTRHLFANLSPIPSIITFSALSASFLGASNARTPSFRWHVGEKELNWQRSSFFFPGSDMVLVKLAPLLSKPGFLTGNMNTRPQGRFGMSIQICQVFRRFLLMARCTISPS